MKREKDKYWIYKGNELKLMNINWTQYLDQAWQCNWMISEWKIETTYGATPEEAFDKMKKKIDYQETITT